MTQRKSLTISQQRRFATLSRYVVLIVGAAALTLPLVWIGSTSFRPLSEVISYPPRFLPQEPTLEAYSSVLARDIFIDYLPNSLVVSLASATIGVAFSVLAAFAFTRFKFRWSRVLLVLVLASQALPGASILLPLLQIVAKLGMYDKPQGLTLVYIGMVTPFATWLLVGYLNSIPDELYEASLVDGCNNFQALLRVVLPLAAPAIVAVWSFSFLVAWNEFFLAFVLTTDRAVTFPVGLVTSLFNQYTTLWNEIAAASLLFSLPPIAVVIAFQRYLIGGLTAGAVKS